MIIEYYKDQLVSLDTIRKKAQNKYNFDERACTGINHLEVLNALQQYGLGHYRVGFGASAADVYRYAKTGPVIVGVHYGSYPTQKGRCNSNNAEIGGKTDCPFNGSHAILAIGGRWHLSASGKRLHRDIFIRDPDHNSPARPEKPKYDRIRLGQLNRAMRNLPRFTAFKNTYIIYPTRSK